MTLHEACSFYGDFSQLMAEIAEELFNEKVEATSIADTFNDVESSTNENSVLKSDSE